MTSLDPLVAFSPEWDTYVNETLPDWAWLERKDTSRLDVRHAYNLIFNVPRGYFSGYEVLVYSNGIVSIETLNNSVRNYLAHNTIRAIREQVQEFYHRYRMEFEPETVYGVR